MSIDRSLCGGRAAVLLCAIAAACRGAAEAPMAPPPPPIAAPTVAAETAPMPRVLPLTGSLVADRQADVAANAAGRVDKTRVERGDVVAQGAALVELDDRSLAFATQEASANLETARARAALADQQCARNRHLLARGAIAKDEWDRVDNACRTATAEAAAARARAGHASASLADTRVRAPFAGVVQDRYVSVGEYVQPSTRVVTLVGISPLRLQLTVAEADVGRVAVGQRVRFEVESQPGRTFTGAVRYIDPAVRSESRDLRVDALVDNADGRLKAGMSANAWLEEADGPALVVPEAAVVGDGKGARVFVVEDGRVVERHVQAGARAAGRVEVRDGLAAGERVVATVGPEIRDGARVK